jgi:hypothetical protein
MRIQHPRCVNVARTGLHQTTAKVYGVQGDGGEGMEGRAWRGGDGGEGMEGRGWRGSIAPPHDLALRQSFATPARPA